MFANYIQYKEHCFKQATGCLANNLECKLAGFFHYSNRTMTNTDLLNKKTNL